MPVVLARVDNRLVHGQVLEAWAPRLGANAILVVDRAAAEDPLRRVLAEGLSSPGLRVRVAAPEAAAGILAEGGPDQKVLLLFPDTEAALEAHAAGVGFHHLNLGNVHPAAGSRPLTSSVHLGPGDVTRLLRLRSRGVELDARSVPSERSPDVDAWLKAERGRGC